MTSARLQPNDANRLIQEPQGSASADQRASIAVSVRELGDWFHNLNLRGVQTAPHHFLGDYPAVKWQRFAHAIPADLHGWTVLDIGCNAGFYSQEMKRRGADRVLGVDSDRRYLAQARLAAEVAGMDIEFRQLSVYDLTALGERFDLHGRALPPATSTAGARYSA
jgi:tRNA (mo5U34)-methyltransferase